MKVTGCSYDKETLNPKTLNPNPYTLRTAGGLWCLGFGASGFGRPAVKLPRRQTLQKWFIV